MMIDGEGGHGDRTDSLSKSSSTIWVDIMVAAGGIYLHV
jgi:hypothetical protein